MAAAAIGFFGGGTNWPLWYDIPFPPYLNVLITLYIGIVAYAIVRHRLMDIEVIIRRALVFAGLFAFVYGIFTLVTFLGQEILSQVLNVSKGLMFGVAVAIVALTVRPLEAFLVRITDRFLFQRKYDYRKTLKEAAKGMAQVTDIDRLFRLIAHFIGMRIRVHNVGVFYRGPDDNKFVLRGTRGKDKNPAGFTIEEYNPLVEWLEEKKEVLEFDEVEHWLKHEKMFPHKSVLRRSLEDIKKTLEKLRVSLCVPCFSKERMLGFLVLGNKLSGDIYSQEDIDVLSTLSTEAAVAIENAQLYAELYQRMRQIKGLYEKERKLFISTAFAFAAAIDAKDKYTHGHTERVTKFCLEIARELRKMPGINLPENFEEALHIAALLHDVGKIGTPDHILNKKGPLTKVEYEEIKKHPIIGASILTPIKELGDVALAIRHHQERYDGTGYPARLKGDDIPLASRIIMVADTFDAMISDRPYRARLMDEVALQEIKQGMGTQLDPTVVEAFVRAYYKGNIVGRADEGEAQKGIEQFKRPADEEGAGPEVQKAEANPPKDKQEEIDSGGENAATG